MSNGRNVTKSGPISDWLDRLFGSVTSKGEKLIKSVIGVFDEDGIFSMENIADFGVAVAIAKLFPADDAGDTINTLSKEFSNFLPEYVNAKIAAGQMEEVAREDLDALINYGVITKRDPTTNQITSRKQSELRGRVGLQMEQMYGIKPQYQVDENNNVIIDQTTGNPITVKTGQPGTMQIAGEALRDEQRLGDLATTATRTEQSEYGKPLIRNLRTAEAIASPELHTTQAAAGESFRNLLAAQDPTKLSGSEMANIERGLGRMGLGVGRTSNMDVIGASHQFSDALAQKQQRLGQALGQTGNVTASLRSSAPINLGTMFGEGTTAMPTTPGQVNFGNTAAQALAPVSSLVQTAGAPQSTTDFARNLLLQGTKPGD
tara:strand:- start:38 stop:1162 length:1125 start_codon:yes stop_codon:yes gene_type:complete